MEYKVRHDQEDCKFKATVDSHQSFIKYSVSDGVIAILSTYVPPAVEGRGVAAELTKTVLEYARENNLKVKPVCSYAVTYMQRNREYQDLL